MPVVSDGKSISTPDRREVVHYPYPCPEPHGPELTCEEAVRRWARRNSLHVVETRESEAGHAG